MLDADREALIIQLNRANALHQGERQATLEALKNWWASYKMWEAQDRFLSAFKEGRLTMRQAPMDALTYGEYLGKDSGTGFNATPRTFKFGADGNPERVAYPTERQRADIGSIKERMNPQNYGMDLGERLKYKKGLHDMSASLCVPHIPKITDQMRWKPSNTLVATKADTEIMVFMPLAKPEDIRVFRLLSALAKGADPEFKLKVDDIRRRMTRIKLADSEDLAAGMRNIGSEDQIKLRYGLSSPVTAEGKLTGKDLERYNKAGNYTAISLPKGPYVPSAAAASAASAALPASSGPPPPPPPGAMKIEIITTEAVISYREHAGARFPVFAKYDKANHRFVCLHNEVSSSHFENKSIPNRWEMTVEV